MRRLALLLTLAALVVVFFALDLGRFPTLDERIAGRPRMLRPVAAPMYLRSCLTGIATGDRAIFVERADSAHTLSGDLEQPGKRLH